MDRDHPSQQRPEWGGGVARSDASEGGHAPSRGIAAWIPWSRQTLIFGISVSLFVHMALLLWAALAVWGKAPASAAPGDGEVPLAVVAENDLDQGLFSGLASDLPALEQLAEPELTTPAESAPAADAQALEMSEVSDVTGAGDVESLGGSEVFGAGGGARFFGVEARGSRFAYVLDVSGSMQGERIEALRAALATSLAGLYEHAKFVIFPYNDAALTMSGGEWVRATGPTKRRVQGWFGSIDPQGGTDPLTAFGEVFDLRPRPDAIYFMTDGEFPSSEQDLLDLLRRENAGGGAVVPIHCITLIERGAEQTMRTIAERSGGSYTHIEADAGGSP